MRVDQLGVAAFKELQDLMAGKMTERLRGKLSTLKAHNRFLDGELIRTCRDLRTYRENNLLAFSEDNRSLKEELEKLKGVQQKLEDKNAKVQKLTKDLSELPTLNAELAALQKWRADAEDDKKNDAEAIEQLKQEKAERTKRMAFSAKAGFDRCFNMAVILEPNLDTTLLDAKYKAEDGKIVYQGKVVHDPVWVTSPGAEEEAVAEGEKEPEKEAAAA